jgi:FKBP-type peptidyl-prolyl cis-trans isomerase FkpA
VASWQMAIIGTVVGVLLGSLVLLFSPGSPPAKTPAGSGSADPAVAVAPPGSAPPAAPQERPVPEGFQETPEGIRYKIHRESTARKPTIASRVRVHYKGWLDDGTEFDSSYKRNEPADFPLRGVIEGWAAGLQLVGEGGEIELELPPRLGYGASGAPPDIPPNAWLHFRVELLQILN